MHAFPGTGAATIIAIAGLAAPASAQHSATGSDPAYPTRHVRIITGGAGNMHDIVARQLGQRLTERLGQAVVIENRPGAGMTIGTGLAARAAPDGHTLLMSDRTAIAVAPSAFRGLSYDPARDLAPIALVARAPLAVVAHPSTPAKTLRELIAFAKARPGKLSYAGSGPATASHIAGEQFKQMTGVEIVLVQYKGSPAALTAVVGGEVAIGFGMIPITLPHVSAGRLRVFAIASNKRFAGLPDIPTATEAGLPGFESELWIGMLAPARTPAHIIDKLNHDIVAILRSPDLQASLLAQGAEPSAGTSHEFAEFIKSETARLRKVVEVAGIRIE